MSNTADGGNNLTRAWTRLKNVFRRYLLPCVQNVEIVESRIYPRLKLPSEELEYEYDMNHANRGFALIFNHENFLHRRKPTRRATNLDRDRLEKVLTRLHFDVKVFNDLRLKDLKKELKKVAELDHSDNDCLLITIMTHGDERNLTSFDVDFKVKMLTKYFTDTRCPSLKGKPRLFLIQACRGKQSDYGYVLPKDEALNERSQVYHRQFSRGQGQETDAIGDEEIEDSDESEGEEDMAHNPPIYKDSLIVRSTMPGFESYRDTDTGSWFIQELCNELEKTAIGSDLLTLLTRVNLRVAYRESLVISGKGKKQILCISTKLSRIMVINDKSEQHTVEVEEQKEQVEDDEVPLISDVE